MTMKLKPVSPGEMLAEEFLKPLGMSNYCLAKGIGVPAQRISAIVAGKRAITADTDLRLCRFFGFSDGWWLRLQGLRHRGREGERREGAGEDQAVERSNGGDGGRALISAPVRWRRDGKKSARKTRCDNTLR